MRKGLLGIPAGPLFAQVTVLESTGGAKSGSGDLWHRQDPEFESGYLVGWFTPGNPQAFGGSGAETCKTNLISCGTSIEERIIKMYGNEKMRFWGPRGDSGTPETGSGDWSGDFCAFWGIHEIQKGLLGDP